MGRNGQDGIGSADVANVVIGSCQGVSGQTGKNVDEDMDGELAPCVLQAQAWA